MTTLPAAAIERAQHQINRNSALLLGHKKFEGRACAEGHTVRYTATGGCTECNLDRAYATRERRRSGQLGTPRGSLRQRIAGLDRLLSTALAAESRAWARVAELEDMYEPDQHGDMS